MTDSGDGDVLAVTDLRKHFGGVSAVSGTSFGVTASGITGLIGPNGAGKTTVVGVIAGAIRADSGIITFRGADITGWSAVRRARYGLIRTFQLSAEFRKLSVLENLVVAAARDGESLAGSMLGRRRWAPKRAEAIERARGLLAEFGISDKTNTFAGELSGGQKRIIELARALMCEPRLLLLDEPMAGVSPAMRPMIVEHLLALRDRGLPMLLIEHEMSVVERCCDTVIVMARGQKLAEGSMSDIRANAEVRRAYLA